MFLMRIIGSWSRKQIEETKINGSNYLKWVQMEELKYVIKMSGSTGDKITDKP